MQPKRIGLYIHDVLYNRGGTEAYTVRMVAALEEIYPEAEIFFVSECYDSGEAAKDGEFHALMKERYGVNFSREKVHMHPVRAGAKDRIGGFILRECLEAASYRYDLFFYCSRGNISFKAKRNIAIIHFPIKPAEYLSGASLPTLFIRRRRNRLFTSSYHAFLPNSSFTKEYLKQYWPSIPEEKILLLYPPIAPVPNLGIAKERIILACSRIVAQKKLELLVDAYKGSAFLSNNYKLIIAGNRAIDAVKYWEWLQAYSKGLNIEFYPNASWDKIVELYNRAQIFWHCKGFGEEDPYMMEHFGMTTVEAMGAGCVPVVINKGGQSEIVTEESGFKWDSIEELVRHSEELAKDEALLSRMSEAAKQRAAFFYTDAFRERLRDILKQVLGDGK